MNGCKYPDIVNIPPINTKRFGLLLLYTSGTLPRVKNTIFRTIQPSYFKGRSDHTYFKPAYIAIDVLIVTSP